MKNLTTRQSYVVKVVATQINSSELGVDNVTVLEELVDQKTFEDKKLALPLQAADMVAYRSRLITSQWVDGVKDGGGFEDNHEFTETLFWSVFAHIAQRKESLRNAYLAGALDYEYIRKYG